MEQTTAEATTPTTPGDAAEDEAGDVDTTDGPADITDGPADADPRESDTGATTCALIDGELPATETDFLQQDSSIEQTRPHCQARIHAVAGAKDSRLQIHLVSETPHTLRVMDLRGEELELSAEGDFTLNRSGEFLVRVDPTDVDAPQSTYTLSVDCTEGCEQHFTRYPVVLMHGAAGFGEILGIEYFFDVTDSMAEQGYLGLASVVDPIASTSDRSRQVQANLDTWVNEGQGRRFNLIGHSQGGLDARYLAGALEDQRIVSVTTISSPHHGTPVADVTAGLVDITGVDSAYIELALSTLTSAIGVPTLDYVGQLSSLTTAGMEAFNVEVPNRDDVYYASWAGRSCSAIDWACQTDNDGEIVAPYLGMTYWLIQVAAGDNDGMCPVASAQWGEFKGTIPADHFDEVGQLVGVTTSSFSHRTFFTNVANDLYEHGF